MNTSPPAVTVGPALPLPPTFCFPAGRFSLIPSIVCHAISPVFALTAMSRDHGGRWHGSTMSRPEASLPIDAENEWNGPTPSTDARSYGCVEPGASNEYVTPGFFFSTHPTSD